jgi:Ca2+-dependent lipid-binding protein
VSDPAFPRTNVRARTRYSTFTVLVDSDHVADGEHVVIRIYDSDRFSSDDSLGMVRVNLLKLVETPADGSNDSLQRQTTTLTAEHAGMKVGGTLDWSWGFFPIHKMPSHSGEQADVTEEEFAAEKTGATTGRKGDSEAPGLLYKLMRGLAPEPFEWEQERRQRRLDSVAWLTGQRAREDVEASLPPTEDYRSGILNFHIHQATDLQMETSSGTFHRLKSKNGNGAIGGRPSE